MTAPFFVIIEIFLRKILTKRNKKRFMIVCMIADIL